MKYKVEKVFGVSNELVESYIEREKVDELFLQGLKSNKHIIVFGSSKQGKTALTTKHLAEDDYVRINCSPDSKPIDIYKSLLRQINVEFKETEMITNETEANINGSIKANVKIPFIAKAEAQIGTEIGKTSAESIQYKTIEYNLNLPQDITEILKNYEFKKRIILENFHYLDEDVQNKLAFHLRVFEDNNILFIILGIWREKNRLSQFNGDLQDRLIEIPVEPWEKDDFKKVVKIGEEKLNIGFEKIIDEVIDQSFDSIGVFQELCKQICIQKNILETQSDLITFEKKDIEQAIKKKIEDYSGRHIRSIETFIEQKVKTTDEKPLYIPYYFIKVLLEQPFESIEKGFKRRYIESKIKDIHHRSSDVRSSDLSYFLHNITKSQIKKKIMPPLFDYDRSIKMLKIIDSTFYFFIKNTDTKELLEDLDKPEDI